MKTDITNAVQQRGAEPVAAALNGAIAATPPRRRRSSQRRAYGTIPSELWLGIEIPGFLSLTPDAKLVELYLLSSPHANMLGLYWLPLPYIAREIRLPEERVGAAIEELEAAGTVKYDPTTEHIYVTHFVKTQVLGTQDGLKPNDKQLTGAHTVFYGLPDTPLKNDLIAKYGKALHLTQ